jgi:hypothetical protein
MSERKLVDPAPELPDDTPLDDVELPTRIRDVLAAAGLKTSAGSAIDRWGKAARQMLLQYLSTTL